MTNNFFKQTANKAKDEAIKAAKQMGSEPWEILKNAGQKAGVPESVMKGKEEPSMMQEVMTGSGSVKQLSEAEEHSINVSAVSRLQEIEAELRRIRMQKEQAGRQWGKTQDELMKVSPEAPGAEKPQPIEMPKTRQKGPQPQGKRGKGTKEIGKQHSG